MKLIITAILLAAFAGVANAQTQPTCPPGSPIPSNAALVCWVNATTNDDGTPIPATGDLALKSTQFQRAQVAATATCSFNTIAQTLTVTSDVTRLYFENLPNFKHCFRGRHQNEAGTWSSYTAVLSKVTTTPAPVKPKPQAVTIY